MAIPDSDEVTKLLHAWAAGDRQVESRLFELVVPHMHALASHLMRRERADHSLQATALLNEAFLKLFAARERDWENRRHFFAVAARAMRRLLIDHARARPKGNKVAIEGMEALLQGRDVQMDQAVTIDRLLDELSNSQPQWCSVVELKFFLGFTDEETAEALNISVRTMQRQYGDARKWLYDRLSSQPTR